MNGIHICLTFGTIPSTSGKINTRINAAALRYLWQGNLVAAACTPYSTQNQHFPNNSKGSDQQKEKYLTWQASIKYRVCLLVIYLTYNGMCCILLSSALFLATFNLPFFVLVSYALWIIFLCSILDFFLQNFLLEYQKIAHNYSICLSMDTNFCVR